jgi:hypothetical protein
MEKKVVLRVSWRRGLGILLLFLVQVFSGGVWGAESPPRNERAVIHITSPESGMRFEPGAVIPIAATAVDPKGYIGRVEFFDREERIGVSELVFIVAPEPGTPIHHSFDWAEARPGEHVIIARAIDSAGDRVQSNPVEIRVGDGPTDPRLPIVSIRATQPRTSEPIPEAFIRPGEFTLRRTGETGSPLRIHLEYAGTAEAETDYDPLPGAVEIPAGTNEIRLLVFAFPDDLLERTESVIASIVPPRDEPAEYRVDPEHARARVEIQDEDRLRVATLEITRPEPGSIHRVGSPIMIEAVAMDPNGYIDRVEFFDGEDRIGVSEIDFVVAPAPGTPIEHSFEWTEARHGEHHLGARAVDSLGNEIRSHVVPIFVGERHEVVVLAVDARDPVAAEPGADQPGDTGTFVIRRVAGPEDVTVYFAFDLGGSAENGMDYARLEPEGVLAAGAKEAEIVVRPLADDRKEGTERVSLTLRPIPCIMIFPPPPECYRIEGQGTALIEIRDAGDSGNRPPHVVIRKPASGAVFTAGTVIEIEAVAEDADGTIARLQIFAGDELLGSTDEAKLTVSWSTAPVGLHRLRAQATDDAGEDAFSERVVIYVRDPAERSFVRRSLPPAYLPGGFIEVNLSAWPPRSLAWVVQDQPPAGWAVSRISDGGVFDPVTGEVKFGPYFGGGDRVLQYTVVPPDNATGPKEFSGSASIDGVSYPIAGDDALLPAGRHHPADADPEDSVMSADEVTRYATAWRQGEEWNGFSIPLSYVTRAGFLWVSGEAYRFEPSQGPPPECWVPSNDASSPLAKRHKPAPGEGVKRRMPVIWNPGRSAGVEFVITPPQGTRAWAVEERVPPGWEVTSVSDDGVFDSEQGLIRWGLFYGSDARRLSFEATPPPDAACTGVFTGYVSLDGSEEAIQGTGRAGAMDEATALRIAGSRREQSGRVRLRVSAPTNQVFTVEASSDLKTWVEVGAHVFTGEELEVEDSAAASGAPHRYYRLRPIGR